MSQFLLVLAGLAAVALLGRFLVHLLWPFAPEPISEVPFLDHAETQTSGDVRVTVSALSRSEGRSLFGVPLAVRGIQPVWVEIENHSTEPLYYLRAGTDASCYSPYEAAWMCRFRAPRRANRRMANLFYDREIRNPVQPGTTRSGFVFTRVDEGTKAIDVDLVGIGSVVHSFTFSLVVPGFRADSKAVDFENLYGPSEIVEVESEAELRRALVELPDCTTDRSGRKQGDPLNVVLVGKRSDGSAAFARRGWHPTEQTYAAAVWRTIRSFLFRARYRYSPVSPLYVSGRRQDISAQKARGSITLRNHARFWMTPLRFRGDPVWIGQISRDIGVRLLFALPPTTHKIDPDVDEARDGLLQDLAYSQALARFAYVQGVTPASREAPRRNLTGDPYFTDGLRVVLFFEKRPMTLDEIQVLGWEQVPTRKVAPEGPGR